MVRLLQGAVHMVRRHYGVRTNRYKLIYYYEIDEWELFDLERDPSELTSVYRDPEYRATVEQLKELLKNLQEQYKVPGEDPVPNPP